MKEGAGRIFYHGGPRGLKHILPPKETGMYSYAASLSSVCRRDRIYVTTNYAAAIMYASVIEKGVVYEVEPIGELQDDPDCKQAGLSFACQSALVVRTHKPKGKHLRAAKKALLLP